MNTNRTVLLMILDGWGVRLSSEGNAVLQANTPCFDRLVKTYECCFLTASGAAVGLMANQMGNSEVGHLNLGAGRIVRQDISRIDHAIDTETLGGRLDAKLTLGANNKLHLIGLLGSGGVHAHDRHLRAILRSLKDRPYPIILHIVTDGRDTPPQSSAEYLQALEQFIRDEQIDATIATVSGRYYMMDRDKRWERTQKAHDVLVERTGEQADTAAQAIQQAYTNGVTDEFILPTIIKTETNTAVEAGDNIFFYNFRADRMRQIVEVFSDDANPISSPVRPHIITMTTYDEDYTVDVLFGMEILDDTLAETVSKHNLTQLHMAETEKYPHVTYFFNGRRETAWPGEDRIVVPSPKVATYDLQPEMSAREMTAILKERLQTGDEAFIVINYANPDMVGHTGDLQAVIKAIETVDTCASEIIDAVLAKDGVVLLTADHGNAELMVDPITAGPHTYHTTNPVPLLVISNANQYQIACQGILADIAPTVLDLLDVPQPEKMTGSSVILKKH